MASELLKGVMRTLKTKCTLIVHLKNKSTSILQTEETEENLI